MSRARVRFVVIATALSLLGSPAAAVAAAAAVDEYSLGVPGGAKVGAAQTDVRPENPSAPPRSEALGVVGETQAARSPLSVAASSLGATLAVLATGVAVGGFAVWTVLSRRARR